MKRIVPFLIVMLLAACNGSATATPAATVVPVATSAPAAPTTAATMVTSVAAAVPATSAPTMAATLSVTMAATGAATKNGTAMSTAASTAAGTMSATAVAVSQYVATDAGSDISVELSNATAAPTQSVISGTPGVGGFDSPGVRGTMPATQIAGALPVKLVLPATLPDLLKQFPELAPYINSNKTLAEMDFGDLYKKMVLVYNSKGATGLATFLKDSGLLAKFNLPESYLDLLIIYDKGGLPAVQKAAKDRGLINSKNEIVASLSLTNSDAMAQVISDLNKLGVTTYPPLSSIGQLEIGIPLDVLAQYQTPGTLIQYLTTITHVNNVAGVYPPVTRAPTGAANVPYYSGKGPLTIGALAWQKAGFTGKGVKVGVLDMGFGGIKKLMNGKDLPKTIQSNSTISDLNAQSETHGTDCAQIVHGAAPDAELYVAFFDDNASWSDAVKYLLDNKVQIITYSIGSSVGPRDGTFGESVTLNKIVKQSGVLWLVAAGNEALDHTTFKYNDSAGDGQHHFDSSNDSLPFVAFDPHTTVVMNWNGSWKGSEKDEYDFSILDKDGNEVATGAEPVKGRKNDYPFQLTTFSATPGDTYYMVIRKAHAGADNTIDIFINNGELPKWARVPGHSVTVPADASGAFTVGATIFTKDTIEPYSSQGPTSDNRVKPDITAPDNEVLPDVPDGFAGTSGATPLVAGAAALVLQAYPNLTAAEVKAYLITNAKDLGAKGADSVFGAGRLRLPDPSTINSDQGPDTNPTAVPTDANGGDATSPPDNVTATAAPHRSATPRPAKGGAAVATIQKSDVKFNVLVDNVKSVQISVSFEIDNLKGKKAILALQVFQADGTTAVKPKSTDYSLAGTLGTYVIMTPGYAQTSYSDLQLALPNSEFGNLSKGKNNLVYIITILDGSDPNNIKALVQADPVPITVTR